jgi:hypothetical protein
MEALLGLIGATVVGAGGWWAGERVGFMTAFMLSAVGSGVGLYWGRRLAREYLP